MSTTIDALSRTAKVLAVVGLLIASVTTAEPQILITGAGSSGKATVIATCSGTGLIFNIPCNSQYIPIGMVL